jgi:hypothetical protein
MHVHHVGSIRPLPAQPSPYDAVRHVGNWPENYKQYGPGRNLWVPVMKRDEASSE